MKLIDFIKEIGVPEFKSIIGNFKIKQRNIYGNNIILLVVILFLSLLALGIAQSSRKYLETKMEDPYVNFIDIKNPIPSLVAPGNEISKKILEKEIDSLNYTSFLDPSVIETREKAITFKHNTKKDQLSGFILKTDNIFYERIKKEHPKDTSKNMVISEKNNVAFQHKKGPAARLFSHQRSLGAPIHIRMSSKS